MSYCSACGESIGTSAIDCHHCGAGSNSVRGWKALEFPPPKNLTYRAAFVSRAFVAAIVILLLVTILRVISA